MPKAKKTIPVIKTPTNPISKEHLLLDLHPFFPAGEGLLPDLQEPIYKLKATLTAILGCQDDETGKFTISDDIITWGLLAALDILDEASSRTENVLDHVSYTWQEMEKRLDQFDIMPREKSDKIAPAVREVRS